MGKRTKSAFALHNELRVLDAYGHVLLFQARQLKCGDDVGTCGIVAEVHAIYSVRLSYVVKAAQLLTEAVACAR